MIESTADGGVPPHVHEHEDECFYVLDGAIRVMCGDEEFDLGPRSFAFLPRAIRHAWDVTSGSATVLIITVPGGFERFMQEWHRAKGDEARVKVDERFGIRFG